MVKERILAVPYTTVFIAQLPKETQDIIREDMKLHARENGYRLEWDAEARDYIGMTRRFCDIEEIYAHTKVDFCEPGEDIEPYERSQQRNIVLKLPEDDIIDLCAKAGRNGMTVSQLLDNFVGTLNSYLRHHNLDLYATGSNSRFLSADIATEFKGRSCELHVQPLTFSEYVNGTGQEVRQAWANYIVTGGIPLVASMGDEQQQIQYLKNLTVETYLKDIIQRNGVRKKQELSDTFDILASVIASPVYPSKIANTFASLGHGEITSETIDRLSAISMELPEKQEQEKKSLYYIYHVLMANVDSRFIHFCNMKRCRPHKNIKKLHTENLNNC